MNAALISGLVAGPVLGALPPVTTYNPLNQGVTASIGVDYDTVQTYTRSVGTTPFPYQENPSIYWFKYTSDGQSSVKFDTLGSDYGDLGPWINHANEQWHGTYNQSQIAVYRPDGSLVAITKNTVDLNGHGIPALGNYDDSLPAGYNLPGSQGLSELYFEPNAPSNPRHGVSPSDPLQYISYGGQKYYRNPDYPGTAAAATSNGHYPVDLNEYHVWNTALSRYVLDANGWPVDTTAAAAPVPETFPGSGIPDLTNARAQSGWRYFDYAREGPGATWNRYDALAAGDYYIAVAASGVIFAGDYYAEVALQYGDGISVENFQPLDPWQFYGNLSGITFGNLVLNVTHTPIPEPAAISLLALAGMCLLHRRRSRRA